MKSTDYKYLMVVYALMLRGNSQTINKIKYDFIRKKSIILFFFTQNKKERSVLCLNFVYQSLKRIAKKKDNIKPFAFVAIKKTLREKKAMKEKNDAVKHRFFLFVIR